MSISSYLDVLLAIIAAPLFLTLAGAVFGWRYRRRVEAAMQVGRQEEIARRPSVLAATPGTTTTRLAFNEIEANGGTIAWANDRERPLRLALLAACAVHFVLVLFAMLIGHRTHLLPVYLFMVSELVLSLMLLRARRSAWASAALAYAICGLVMFPEIRSLSGVLNLLNAGQAILYPLIGGLVLFLRPIRAVVSLLLGFVAFVLVQTAIVAIIVLLTYVAGHEAITPSSISAVMEAQHGLLLLAALTQIAAGIVFFWILGRRSLRGPVLGLCLLGFSGIVVLPIAKLLHRAVPAYFQALILGIPLLVLMWSLGWFCLQGLHQLRERQWLASEYDRSSFVWAYLSLIAWGFSGGALAAAMAFPAAVIVQRALVWRHWIKNREIMGKRLVLLRVFGRPRQAIRLLESIRSPWRLIGSVDLILGTDIATFEVSPAALEAYLKGQFHAAYLQTHDDVDARFGGLDRRLGGDGYYPIHQLSCFNNTWQYTVVKLIPGADAVLMDLRGFGESNLGCIFELSELLNLIELERILVLVDRNTDRDLLRRVLEKAWAVLRNGSPNIGKRDPVVNVVSDHRALSSHLLRISQFYVAAPKTTVAV